MSDYGGSSTSSDQSSSSSSSSNRSDAPPSESDASDHGQEHFEQFQLNLQNNDPVRIAQLEAQCLENQRRIAQLESERLDNQRIIGEHAATIIRLQAALDQRQQEEEIVQQNNRERMDEMVDAVLENRILAEGQCAETVALEDDILKLKMELDQSEATIAEKRDESNRYRNQLNTEETKLLAANSTITELQQSQNRANQTITELREELFLSDKENKRLAEANDVLKSRIRSTEEQSMHQETATTSSANNQSDSLTENEMLKKNINNLEANAMLLRRACNNHLEENERLKAISERLENKLRREDSLEIANVNLQRQLSELSTTLESERRTHSQNIAVLRERIGEFTLEHANDAANDGRNQIEHLLELLRPATPYANVLVERRNRELHHNERLRLLGEVVVRVEALMLRTGIL